MPSASPSAGRPYLSFGLSEPLTLQSATPPSVPQAVVFVNQAACSTVGRKPKRDSPHDVPKPMTAPAEPSRSCGVTPESCGRP